jgi:hypothetical protein
MTNQHRATPEQWVRLDKWSTEDISLRTVGAFSCLLELCARIEALEAAAKEFSETIRAALDRWGNSQGILDSSPQPVPVSERLPEPEDCDAEGRCWVGYAVPKDDLETEYNPSWELCKFHPPDEVWLPHWALPRPTPTNTINQED